MRDRDAPEVDRPDPDDACSDCGAVLPEDVRFCEECGVPRSGTTRRRVVSAQEQIEAAMCAQREQVELTGARREAALELLRDARLTERILADYETCGLVGEETNKLVCYLACTSRRLPQPLAVFGLAQAAALGENLARLRCEHVAPGIAEPDRLDDRCRSIAMVMLVLVIAARALGGERRDVDDYAFAHAQFERVMARRTGRDRRDRADGQRRAPAGPAGRGLRLGELGRILAANADARLERFAEARNLEIEKSMTKVSGIRLAVFAAKRNREIAASMTASGAAHLARFAEARNKEIDASANLVNGHRMMAFAATRNAEIELSVARVKGESELAALKRIVPHMIETGSIELATPAHTCR